MLLNVPDDCHLDEIEVRCFMTAKLYESGKLSLGKVAGLAGFPTIKFSEILRDYDVELIQYSLADIASDAAKI
jgi:predicted HTH domain antitoxin